MKAPRPKQAKQKCDPKLIQAARELRDRWLEQAEREPALLAPEGKYDVTKQLGVRPLHQPSPAAPGEGAKALLPAA